MGNKDRIMNKTIEQVVEDSKYLGMLDGNLAVCHTKCAELTHNNMLKAGAEHESTTPFFYRVRRLVNEEALKELKKERLLFPFV